ncbi:MAG: T9SS type A sorting domain-containing protein [Bacteroidota bacterium]|nr:T9SS type A sorting domain-containing protein [Bacteroidota bacterium]
MNQKKFLLLIIVSSLTVFSFKPTNDNPKQQTENQITDSRLLDVNNISTWFSNNGSFNRDPLTGNAGFEWPKGSAKSARYASGLWLGAKVGNDTLVAIAEYDYEYLSGYIDNNGDPQGSTDPLYKTYSIIRGDTTSPDYLNWPVSQGAYINSQGTPFFLGTQTMFYSYTDGYPEAHGNRAGSTAPFKAVILETNWAYTNVNLLDVAFTEFKIINRSNHPWVKAYISIWTDDDLGGAGDDAVGIDTVLRLGYTYNYSNNDPTYGNAPPAVGFLILRQPLIPSNGDTARYYDPPGSNNLVVKPNFREMQLSSFNLYTNGDPSINDPQNYHETYLNLQGFKRTGAQWINPITNEVTKFPYSGDPVTGTGWIETSQGDRRSLMSYGPLTINPNDTQSVIMAQVIARGTSNTESIRKLRTLAKYVDGIYHNNFQSVLGINHISTEIPNSFKLEQNYPNPFNPGTVIRYSLIENRFINLKVYDVLGNEVATLVNEKQSIGSYEVEFNAANLSSGIYFYKLITDGFADTKRMILLK